MTSRHPIVASSARKSGGFLAAACALFALGMLGAAGCGKPSPGAERLTPEKAAELIKNDAKFVQPLEVSGRTIGTRALVDVAAVTQGTGPGLDPGEAEAQFTYRWVLATPEPDASLRSALPPEAGAELSAPAPLKAKAALRRFGDGWHVMRYRNMYVSP